MCRRTKCKQCGKPSWAGCGAHVEMVLGDVPRSERCSCRESARTAHPKSSTKKSTAAVTEPTSAVSRFKAWLRQ